jgi:hypothetical protein
MMLPVILVPIECRLDVSNHRAREILSDQAKRGFGTELKLTPASLLQILENGGTLGKMGKSALKT